MAKISVELNNIKNATFGREVRGAIHDGIKKINEEVEGTTGRQERLEKTFDNLVGSGDISGAEVVAARVAADGKTYNSLRDRLNSSDSIIEQLVQHSTEKSELDDEGIFTIINLKRSDGTLYCKSELYGGESPLYSNRKETYYASNGIDIIKEIIYNRTYNEDEFLVSEVIV